MTQNEVEEVVEWIGEVWHEIKPYKNYCKCNRNFPETHINPDPISSDIAVAWAAFGWLWERMRDKKMLPEFLHWYDNKFSDGTKADLIRFVSPVPLWEKVYEWIEEKHSLQECPLNF